VKQTAIPDRSRHIEKKYLFKDKETAMFVAAIAAVDYDLIIIIIHI